MRAEIDGGVGEIVGCVLESLVHRVGKPHGALGVFEALGEHLDRVAVRAEAGCDVVDRNQERRYRPVYFV